MNQEEQRMLEGLMEAVDQFVAVTERPRLMWNTGEEAAARAVLNCRLREVAEMLYEAREFMERAR